MKSRTTPSGKFTNHDSSGRPKGSHLQKWLNKSRENIPIFSAWLEQAVRGGEFGVVRPPNFHLAPRYKLCIRRNEQGLCKWEWVKKFHHSLHHMILSRISDY